MFVHGLTVDRDRTWTAHGSSTPWPQTLLPELLPKARILSFGYDAYVTDWKHMVSMQKVSSHANDLLHDLAAYRSTRIVERERPIIFIAHSLGGLVVKDALLTGWKNSDSSLSQILSSTRAIAFLGTPHTGSDLAVWAERLVGVLGIFKQVDAGIVALLRKDSEVLSRVHDDILKMIQYPGKDTKQHRIAVTCFYEALPMRLIGFIVPKESAIILGYLHISIHAHHRDMVRFADIDDPGLQSVVAELRKWIAEITMQDSPEDELNRREDIEKRCYQSLAFPEMDNRRLNMEDAAELTCGWLFDHPTYRAWHRYVSFSFSAPCIPPTGA